MSEEAFLTGKKILIVDDEPDVLDTLEQLLSMCQVEKASTFEEARILLESQNFDLTILDIMGVNGYKLLEMAKKRNITTVMLTAHAFSPENLKKSIKEGADSYLPKEEIKNISTFLIAVLKAKRKRRAHGDPGKRSCPLPFLRRDGELHGRTKIRNSGSNLKRVSKRKKVLKEVSRWLLR
jgi:DNA-binding response OmpR family regulator